MNLLEMAGYVCSKVRQSDALAITKAKGFLAKRYEMLWAEELWKDSVYQFAFTLGLGTTETQPTPNTLEVLEAGYYFMPQMVDRVLAIRSDDGALPVQDEPQLFRATLDEYAETGSPVKFLKLPPAVAQFIVADRWSIAGGAADFALSATVRFIAANSKRVKEDVQISATTEFSEDGLVLETVTKPATDGPVSLNSIFYGVTFHAMAAADTEIVPRQRIRVLPVPTTQMSFRALVKKKLIPLEDDNDSPELAGIDNCLMAFAQADMLQRGRQYGKAAAVVGEATALLSQFKRIAVTQEAHNERVVPVVESVSGDVDQFSGKGYF
jgi:hypothetical protein